MSKEPTKFTDGINEGSTAISTAPLRDERGRSFPRVPLMRVHAVERDGWRGCAQCEQCDDSLNQWALDLYAARPLDTAIQDPTQTVEADWVTFQGTFHSGASQGN